MKKKITLPFIFLFSAMHASAFTVTLTANQVSPICQYGSVDFSAIINDIAGHNKTAVWKVDGITVLITAASIGNAYFVYPNPGSFSNGFIVSGNHQVWCEVSSPSFNSGNPVYSDTLSFSITQNEPPNVAISDVMNGNHICVGGLDVITAVPFDAGTPSYIWYVDGIPDASSVISTFNYVPLTQGSHFVYCEVHSSDACDSLAPVNNPLAISNIIFVGVDPCAFIMPTTGNPNNIVTCGGQFMDSGWNTANYSNNENGTVSMCPALPGQFGMVTFISFAVQAPDMLTIYSGDNISGLTLIGNYNSLNPPSSNAYTSFASNGCLTFSFVSNSSVTDSGWVANFACSPVASINEFENNAQIKIYPNPSDGKINLQWENPSGVECEIFISDYIWKIISEFRTNENSLSIDDAALQSGVYFVTIKAGEKLFRSPVVVY